LVRPQNWFGEETFTVNGLPFTSVEMGDKRPDVVRRLMVDESRVREFRCWIDLDDVPNRSEGFLLSNVDKRTLAPLVPSHCKYFSEAHTPIPEPKLRIRVHGSEDEGSFIRYGAHIYGNLVHTLDRALGKTFDDFRSVMDWGCGCGRVLRNVATRHKVNLTGVDIDSEAIGWCEEAFPDCSFHAIRRDPPLPLASESIDLTYGISVLTHLSERDQFKWLEELRRVTRPGGVVLLTVHGDHAWFRVEKSCTAYLDWKRHGFRDAYRDSAIDGVIDDPNYYRDVYHDGSYIVREWSKYFRVVEILPGMVLDYQDLVVLVRE
jgi:SAM-dependent methyltransferase